MTFVVEGFRRSTSRYRFNTILPDGLPNQVHYTSSLIPYRRTPLDYSGYRTLTLAFRVANKAFMNKSESSSTSISSERTRERAQAQRCYVVFMVTVSESKVTEDDDEVKSSKRICIERKKEVKTWSAPSLGIRGFIANPRWQTRRTSSLAPC